MSRLEHILSDLRRFYGLLPSPPRDPFQLFVWEVLSSHSTPRKRDAALAALKKIAALTPDAMWRAPHKKLEDTVAQAGPHLEERMGSLRNGVEIFRRTPDLARKIRGPLVAARRAVTDLPRMGEGGAYRMLLFAGEHAVLPVDAGLSRAACRLGYGHPGGGFSKVARSIRGAVARELPVDVDAYRRAFVYLSHHGSSACTTQPHCTVCPLSADCPEGQKRLRIAD